MKYLALSLVIVALLFGAIPLSAQAQLVGELVIDSVSGYIIQMRLIVENIGDQTFSYEFPDSEMSYYSINGEAVHEMVLPVVIPFTLDPGASFIFNMTHNHPLDPGVYVIQGYLAIIDEQGNPMPIGDPQTVIIGDAIPITIGAGDQLSRIPIDFYWRSTLYECVFTAEEMNHTSGWITSISFYNNFPLQSFLNQLIHVYLAHVVQDDLAAGLIESGILIPVFNGLVDFPIGSNEINIPLSSAIYYNGIHNLGLVVFRPIPSSYQTGVEPFQAQAADPLRSRKLFSDHLNLNPMNNPAANPNQHIGFMPKTTFYLIPYTSGNSNENLLPDPLSVNHHPNPVYGMCSIELRLVKPMPARVDIFNLRGQKVRSLHSDNQAKVHLLQWDTRDSAGKTCPSGIYFYRVHAGKTTLTKRLILLH
ncbi:MAG: T9SS type A sorting domain-containing protein [Candidatus Cloacimonadaceae bacterium]|nr:T9SS type A sorting domain-containing protein [Candidatus Cloacimonadaceae bacterium]